MDKNLLRKQMVERRTALADDYAKRLSSDIGRRVQLYIDWPSIRSVHMYHSRDEWNEVDTSHIETFLSHKWPHIAVTIGAPERHSPIPRGVYDLIVVPLVAFDERLHRIGFGGGWYDRFLANHPNAIKLGLAYEMQRVSQLPDEPHDVRLDVVVTERDVFTI